MRTLNQTDTPIGLAILVALLAWIGSQLYAEVRGSLIASDGMVVRVDNGKRSVVYHLTNESLTLPIAPLKFALLCPNETNCLTPALDSFRYAQIEQVSPWNLQVEPPEADSKSASVEIDALPPGGTVQVVLSVPDEGVFPVFYYMVAATDVAVPKILPPSNPLVFVARHYLELLCSALVATIALVGWWMFSTGSRNDEQH